MKTIRQETILRLIQTESIGTQEELRKRLCEEGFPVTQATVSRDIKILHLIKKADKAGKYHYQKPITTEESVPFVNNIKKIDYAGNTIVIKCVSGTAQAVCTVLDKMNYSEIVGTLAGDDTIFILVRSEETAEYFTNRLKEIFQNRW